MTSHMQRVFLPKTPKHPALLQAFAPILLAVLVATITACGGSDKPEAPEAPDTTPAATGETASGAAPSTEGQAAAQGTEEQGSAPSAGPAAGTGGPSGGGTHVVRKGETLRRIARKRYQDDRLWPIIYRANLASLPDPNKIPAGVKLQIPALEGNSEDLTDGDIRNIARGYILAYLAYKRLRRPFAAHYLWSAKLHDPGSIEEFRDRIDLEDLRRPPPVRR